MLFVGLRCLVVATAATPQFTKTERTALDHLQLVTYIVYHKYINPKIKEIMSEEIRYQINGQLADNTVTVDNKEDMILVPVSNGSADEERIIAEMKAEDSGCGKKLIATSSTWRSASPNAC